ncbi:MAG: sugar transferase [Anaerolineae bacterium]|nr:MAG: sugar transferase [Anaerolineae bacterium]
MLKHFGLRFVMWLSLADLLFTALALRLSAVVRLWLPWGAKIDLETVTLSVYIYLKVLFICTVVIQIFSVYDPKRTLRLVDELQQLVAAIFMSTLGLAGALYFSFRDVSRLQVIYFFILDLMLLLGLRLLVRLAFVRRGGHRHYARRVLIVGAGEVGRRVASMIQEYAWAGLELVGYLDDDPSKRENDLPVLGGLEDAPRMVQRLKINEVVVALPLRAHERLAEITFALQQVPVNIRVVPDYFNLAFLRATVEDFGGVPLITLREPALTEFQRIVKRAFDLVLSAALLAITLPVMGLIALVIKLDSPGPVIFRHQRVGESGKLFLMLKFRSMVDGADEHLEDVIRQAPDGTIVHKHPDDPRITRVGRFLRTSSLDELPQLFNVLKGEMSLVGPRPEMPWLVERYEDWQLKRLAVPPGITGWWQINSRADKVMHLHTEEDLFYIKNYSILLDLQILWRTIGAVLKRRGAY